MLPFWMTDPVVVGVGIFVLMSLDRALTVAQQKEVTRNYGRHYEIYPTDTIEGNPLLQEGIRQSRYLSVRHILVSLAVSASVGWLSFIMPPETRSLGLGTFFGLFLLVNTQHLSNLMGYYFSRRGVEGKLTVHRRTALKTQAGRYLSWGVLLSILAALTGSTFLFGVALAALVSAGRQGLWLGKVPGYDHPPKP